MSVRAAGFDLPSAADGPALAPRISGGVGLCLTSLLFILASWRLLYHFSGRCTGKYEEEDVMGRGVSTKRLLHVLLWGAAVVESVAYSYMVATNSSSKLSYTLLDIVGRGILEFSTFVVGTVHWFHKISETRTGGEERLAYALVPALLALATVAVTVSSTVEAVDLARGGYASVDDFHARSTVHRASLLVDAVAYSAHAVIVAKCGRMVHRRIASLPTFAQVGSHARRNIVRKMIVPMLLCSLSYALRAGWTAAALVGETRRPDTHFESGVGWWVGCCWLPASVPAVMLLYSIRKRDRAAVPLSAEDAAAPLVQGPETEVLANPFRSFQRTFQEFEEEENASVPSGKYNVGQWV